MIKIAGKQLENCIKSEQIDRETDMKSLLSVGFNFHESRGIIAVIKRDCEFKFSFRASTINQYLVDKIIPVEINNIFNQFCLRT